MSFPGHFSPFNNAGDGAGARCESVDKRGEAGDG